MSIEPVYVAVFADDGELFDLNLTRVPCVGEIVYKEEQCYRVFEVHHSALSPEGKAPDANHAYLSVHALDGEPPIPGQEIRKKRSRAAIKEVRRKAKAKDRIKKRARKTSSGSSSRRSG